jgi:hypothetical protein
MKEKICLYNFKGEVVRQYGSENDKSSYLESWTDTQNNLKILHCTEKWINLIDFDSSKEEKRFIHDKYIMTSSCLIQNIKGSPHLIVAAVTGEFNVFELNSKKCILSMDLGVCLGGLISWGSYILVGSFEEIVVVETNDLSRVSYLECQFIQGYIGTLRKLKHIKFGESLLVAGKNSGLSIRYG